MTRIQSNFQKWTPTHLPLGWRSAVGLCNSTQSLMQESRRKLAKRKLQAGTASFRCKRASKTFVSCPISRLLHSRRRFFQSVIWSDKLVLPWYSHLCIWQLQKLVAAAEHCTMTTTQIDRTSQIRGVLFTRLSTTLSTPLERRRRHLNISSWITTTTTTADNALVALVIIKKKFAISATCCWRRYCIMAIVVVVAVAGTPKSAAVRWWSPMAMQQQQQQQVALQVGQEVEMVRELNGNFAV